MPIHKDRRQSLKPLQEIYGFTQGDASDKCIPPYFHPNPLLPYIEFDKSLRLRHTIIDKYSVEILHI